MFDIGWTELLVVAVIAILVVGPKDLPRMLRTFGETMGKLRRMANEFQGQFNDAIREAERQADLEGVRKSVSEVADINPLADVKKDLEETNAALSGDVTPSIGAPVDSEAAPKSDDDESDSDWSQYVDAPSNDGDPAVDEPPTPAKSETKTKPEPVDAGSEQTVSSAPVREAKG